MRSFRKNKKGDKTISKSKDASEDTDKQKDEIGDGDTSLDTENHPKESKEETKK